MFPIPHTDNRTNLKERLNWVDAAKGLGLFLVIWGHFLRGGTWDVVRRAIYAFHMPMYFILSGFVAHTKKGLSKDHIKNYAYRLLTPSAIFLLLSLPVYFYETRHSGFTFLQHIRTIFFIDGRIPYNDPLWFFIVLFITILLVDATQIFSRSLCYKIACVIGTFLCGYIVYSLHIKLHFGLDKVIFMLGFYLLGHIMRIILPLLKRSHIYIICVISAFVFLICGIVLNEKVSVYSVHLGNYWLFVVSGICGSIVWFAICSLVQNVSIFRFWGYQTIFIVCTHYFGITIVIEVAKIIGLLHTEWFNFVSLVISVVALYLYIPICNLVNKHCPFLNGRKHQRIQ